MDAFQNPQDLIKASNLAGPADLYQVLLTVKNGFGNGKSALGSYSFTKADIKRASIDWSFVANACEILGLKLTNRAGRYGHSVSK
jgi:hypothetical protein